MADFSNEPTVYVQPDIDYSKISFDESVSELGRIVKLQSNNVQDFFRSSTGRRLAEMFATTLQVEWKYIESSMLESFLISAYNYSSVIAGASSLGYSIRRPISSITTIRAEVTGAVGTYNGKFSLPIFSGFDVNGVNFITIDEYVFNWDYNGSVIGPDEGARIVQGSFRTRKFIADGKKKFQKFSFMDSSFSNYFGENDLVSGSDLSDRITSVLVNGVAWEIDRRTLYSANKNNAPFVRNGVLVESRNKKCIVRTGNDGKIEIIFGDGIISEIPRGIVEIRYLSTLGSAGTMFNSQDIEANFNGPEPINFIPASISNDNIKFYLNSSPLGGDDIESIESVKYNAPKIYASLDRYVIDDDYIAGLKTLGNVKYAIAYGEDELGIGDYRYSNVIVYSVLKNLYVTDNNSTILRPATPGQYIFSGLKTVDILRKMQDSAGWPVDELSSMFQLDEERNELDDIAKYNSYVENYGKIFRLSKQNLENGSELETINNNLKEKGQLTCRHIYVPPKVHKFKMKVIVYTSPMISKADLKSKIQQEAYSYLKENTRFNFPVYSSKIVKQIENKTGIIGCHVEFIPSDLIPNDSVFIDTLTKDSSYIFSSELIPTLKNIQDNYYTSVNNIPLFRYFVSSVTDYNNYLYKYFCKNSNTSYDIKKMNERNISDFIETMYRETLGKLILNPNVYNTPTNITSILLDSSFNNPDTGENIYDIFVRWAVQFRKDTNYYSAKALLNDQGDISSFSIAHEIAQIDIDVNTDIRVEGRVG